MPDFTTTYRGHMTVYADSTVQEFFDVNVQIFTIFGKARYLECFLFLEYGNEMYVMDFCRYFSKEALDLNLTLAEILSDFSELELFTYCLPRRGFLNQLNSFRKDDVHDPLIVSACNFSSGEKSDITDDPGYQDLFIGFDSFKLDYCLPVINNLIYMPEWYEGSIYIPGQARLIDNRPDIFFLGFHDRTVMNLTPITSPEDSVAKVPNTTALLVLDGVLETAINRSLAEAGDQIRLSEWSRHLLDAKSEEDLELALTRSFIIQVESEHLWKQTCYSVKNHGAVEFSSMEPRALMLDKKTNKVHSQVVTQFIDASHYPTQRCFTNSDDAFITRIMTK